MRRPRRVPRPRLEARAAPVRGAVLLRRVRHRPVRRTAGVAELGSRDYRKAVADYARGLGVGSSRPLPELFTGAGIRFDFSRATLGPLMDAVLAELKVLERGPDRHGRPSTTGKPAIRVVMMPARRQSAPAPSSAACCSATSTRPTNWGAHRAGAGEVRHHRHGRNRVPRAGVRRRPAELPHACAAQSVEHHGPRPRDGRRRAGSPPRSSMSR